MTIGNLYNANNVIVGQAAALFAPVNTPLPTFTATFPNIADIFDFTAWYTQTITITGTVSFSLSDGLGHTAGPFTQTSTGANIQTALNALNNGITYTVSGAAGGPYVILASGYGPVSLVAGFTGTVALTGGLWTPTGATDQGWKYGTNKNTNTINIEEQSTPVGMTTSSQAVTLEGSLSEDISRTLALAYNATTTAVAPTSTSVGYDNVVLTDTVLYYAVALLTTNPQGLGRIIYAPKWSQLSNVSTDFRRASDKRMYPVSFATVCATNQIQVINVTSAHS